MIDTHAHLDFADYAGRQNEVVSEAVAAGLSAIVTVGAGDGIASNRAALALADASPHIFATIGVHPHDARLMDDPASWIEIEDLLERRHPKVVAVGEVGLDFHYLHSPADLQEDVFRRFIRLASRHSLPLVVHDRESNGLALAILEQERAGHPLAGVVFHCFSGGPAEAERLAVLGHSISVGGVLTFRNAGRLREAVRAMPRHLVMLETDSPYLSPEPYRGTRNRPQRVVLVARALAGLWGCGDDEVERITDGNADRFFRLAQTGWRPAGQATIGGDGGGHA